LPACTWIVLGGELSVVEGDLDFGAIGFLDGVSEIVGEEGQTLDLFAVLEIPASSVVIVEIGAEVVF
jgi:hypothetical protein